MTWRPLSHLTDFEPLRSARLATAGPLLLLSLVAVSATTFAQATDPSTGETASMVAWQEPEPLAELAPGDVSSDLVTETESVSPTVPSVAGTGGPSAELGPRRINSIEPSTPAPSTPSRLFDLGVPKWKIHTGLNTYAVFDDNIYVSDLRKESDVYFTVAPSVAFGWGDYKDQVSFGHSTENRYEITRDELKTDKNNFFFGSYTPSYTYFSVNSSESSLNHDLSMNSQWQLPRLVLSMQGRYQSVDQANYDIGDRVHSDVFTATISGNYNLSDKTSVNLDVSGSTYLYEEQLDSSEVTVSSGLNYQIMPKTNIGVAATIGYLTVESSAHQIYEQFTLNGTWYPFEKLSLKASGGVEARQTEGTDDNQIRTIFSLGASHKPFDGTDLGFEAYRRVQNSSLFPGDNYTSTGVGAQLGQRLLQRLHGALNAGFSLSEYDNASDSGSMARQDEIFYAGVALSVEFTRWSTIEIGYEYRQNESNSTASFHQNVCSLHFNLLF